MTYDICHDLLIQASPEVVYRAISEPVRLVQWWPLECSGTPREGEEYRFYFGPAYDWSAAVIEAIPQRTLEFRMVRSDEDWAPTRFGFELEPRGEATWVRFRHSGWREQNEHFRHSSFCWAILLKGLKDLVERGVVIPFAERS